MILLKKIFLSAFIIACLVQTGMAQNDTLKKPVIEVTSSFKPSLKPVSKIDFFASAAPADTALPVLNYNIPPQNLFFSFQPSLTKPLSLQQDSVLPLGAKNQLKIGFGNFSTPYISGAITLGDAKSGLFNIYGDYISSKGKLEFQNYYELNLKSLASFFTAGHEIYGGLGFYQHQYFDYGREINIFYPFTKDQLRKKYRDFSIMAGVRNTEPNDLGIYYNPSVSFHSFTREDMINENTFEFDAPAYKSLSEHFRAGVAISGSLNNYQIKNSSVQFSNRLFQISPEISYTNTGFSIKGGVIPSWYNDEFLLLPNVYAELKVPNGAFGLIGGWMGRYIKNNVRTLSEKNPFIKDPTTFDYTKEVSYFGGIKAELGTHLSVNGRVSFINYRNAPLFMDDIANKKGFVVAMESRLNNFQIHGDINFVKEDKISLTAGLDINNYTGLIDHQQPWGLYPIEIKSSLRWHIITPVVLKANLFSFTGGKALDRVGNQFSRNGGTDLSIGSELIINKKFSAWLDFNNILNQKYERWNNYPVYGFQIMGGLIIHF